MRIRLSEIVDEPFRWAETRSIDVASLERDLLVALGPISWAGEVTRTATGHVLVGRLEYEQQLACPRCLKPTAMPVAVDISLLALPHSSEPMLGEIELEEEDLNVLYVEEGELDTDPILIEQLQLNVPMRKLCRDNCRGLCPTCGVDRNEKNCDCEEETVDSRWEALKDLRLESE
jgi:uncharacterized protein